MISLKEGRSKKEGVRRNPINKLRGFDLERVYIYPLMN
jgi:hypothetical protein